MWDCHNGANQKWNINDSDQIVSELNGKCLDIEGANQDNLANVIMWDCHNGANQKWNINDSDQIVSELNGKCLDIEGANQDNLANVIMWDCHNGANQKWNKGSSVVNNSTFDDDFKNDIKQWLENPSIHESINDKKMEEIMQEHDTLLKESIENVRVSTNTPLLKDSEIESAIDYIFTETIKEENLKIKTSEGNSLNVSVIDFLDVIGVPTADAACPKTTNPKYKQHKIDIDGGKYGKYSFNGNNDLYLVSYSDNSKKCERTYTLYFYDEDHPWRDSFYDEIRKVVFKRTHDIESFTIKNNNKITFDRTWSSSNDYDCLVGWTLGCHETTTKTYSPGSTIYVSNTWNHMIDTSDTNRSISKVTVP